MLKTVVLVPVADNAGTPFPPEAWHEFEARLRRELGGFSMGGVVRGEWVNPDGRIYSDTSRQYTVALEVRQVPAWLDILEWALERFGQQALYVEIAGAPEILGRRA